MKPITHKTVTRLAIDLYCKNNHTSEIYKNRSYIIDGTADEDEVTIERAKNWHFFRSSGSPIPTQKTTLFILECKLTSEDIFAQRVDELKSSVHGSKEFYNRLGRILHHIQDMSTPSHVLPIYHDMFVKDYFEDFMGDNDAYITNEDIESALTCEDIKRFKDIYDKAAYEMLHILKGGFEIQTNTQIKILPYSLFWKSYQESEYKKIKGFGVYGEQHHYFKKNYLPQNNSFGITKETLLGIQKRVTTQAIQNSLVALFFLSAQEF